MEEGKDFLVIAALDDSIDLNPAKPKKRMRRLVHRIPPILKRDIRRLLPTMMVNAFNSVDEKIISQFFTQFAARSCSLLDFCQDNSARRLLPLLTSEGLDNMISIVGREVNSTADFICQVSQAEIHRQSNQPGSQLVIHSQIKGTRIFSQELLMGDCLVVGLSASLTEVIMSTVMTVYLDNNNRMYRVLLNGEVQYR
eukprot:scaffold654_cov207-Ochromonas_danica.AAC.35